MSSSRKSRSTPRRVLKNDKQVLDAAADIQQDTLSALRRIQTTVDESEIVGASTLAALYDQRNKLDKIHEGADRVDQGLKNAEKLQDRLGRWSLRFNKRSATREVKKEIKAEEKSSSLATTDSSSTSTTNSSSPVVRETPAPKKKQQSRLIRKSAPGPSWQTKPTTRSRLLDGTELKGPHKEKLEELQDVDDEIDDALDAVSQSLDRLMDINAGMSGEVQHQTTSISRVAERTAEADRKQRIINKRATKFMDGKLRKQNERADALPGVSKAATMTAARAMI